MKESRFPRAAAPGAALLPSIPGHILSPKGENRLHVRAAFLGLFFAYGETEPSSLPALDGIDLGRRSLASLEKKGVRLN